jgi:flagellar motility protein MotE (MotC chaperone)
MKLTSLLLAALLGSVVLAGNLSAAGGGGKETEKKAEEAPPAPMREPAERQFTPTETQLLLEIDRRRIELDRREQAIELREKLVDLMEQRLNTRVTELTTLKAELETLLGNVSGKDDAELKQLAALYGAMKPTVAAGVLNRLENTIVLDIFRNMPAKRSAKIMESLDPAKSRFITELMAERTPPPSVSETLP